MTPAWDDAPTSAAIIDQLARQGDGHEATATAGRDPVALAHDYLTQRGGAERVVLALSAAFPGAPLYTTLYYPEGTYPEVGRLDVRTSRLDRVPGLGPRHRLAFPLLAAAASSLRVDADVTICSSSGWAHGVEVTGRKVVYCYTPARWLYQRARYLEGLPLLARPALGALGTRLRAWDRRAAHSAHRYLVTSTAVRERVRRIYGIDAEVVPPPVAVDLDGPVTPIEGIEPGFVLSVGRLLAYKNVDVVAEAVRRRPSTRLVIVGTGPLAARLAAQAGPRIQVVGEVADAELRWLYRSCSGLVSASFEDFGLTPIEAAAYAKPSAVLRFGGFCDTVEEGATGVFFDEPSPGAVADALGRMEETRWDEGRLRAHAKRYAPARFAQRMAEIVADERAALG